MCNLIQYNVVCSLTNESNEELNCSVDDDGFEMFGIDGAYKV